MTRTWDIFCSVVDNYGDVGVCWRLARQLAYQLRQPVRLWVDRLESFHRLCHAVDPALESQEFSGVDIRRWRKSFAPVTPADIVIEGFGAPLPETYIDAMAVRSPAPVWINLEYLSAESWVEGCHGLPSPQPRLPLVKYFFFPGFTSATGGLLMESGLAKARDTFQHDSAARELFWHDIGVTPPPHEVLKVSLFCYDNPALPGLIAAWTDGPTPVVCMVPAGTALAQISAITGCGIAPDSRLVRGSLTIEALPFLDLDQYDRLLWACDLNFVRGEDSFVRAQLAARPLVWQVYPQQEGAHVVKVNAFLDRYVRGLDEASVHAIRASYTAWNQQLPEAGRCWEALFERQAALAAHARVWAGNLAAGGSLAIKLAEFCKDRLE